MATNTTRLALVKPDPTENVDISVINANSDKLDAAVDRVVANAGARTSLTGFEGLRVFQTDTKAYWVYTGGAWNELAHKYPADVDWTTWAPQPYSTNSAWTVTTGGEYMIKNGLVKGWGWGDLSNNGPTFGSSGPINVTLPVTPLVADITSGRFMHVMGTWAYTDYLTNIQNAGILVWDTTMARAKCCTAAGQATNGSNNRYVLHVNLDYRVAS